MNTPAPLGRYGELEVLQTLLDRMAAGRDDALVLTGEPGTGLSTLLGWAAAKAPGRVVRLTGIPDEAWLPYAALSRLSGEAGVMLDTTGPETVISARFAESMRMTAEAGEGTSCTLLVIDDAGHLDPESARVLAAIAAPRRVRRRDRCRSATRPRPALGVLFALHVPASALIPLSRLPQHHVAGLAPEHAARLIRATAPAVLPELAVARMAEAHGGVPRALIEACRNLSPERPCPAAAMLQPPTLGPELAEAFGAPLLALPGRTRNLLLTAAADPALDTCALLKVGGELGFTAADAAPAAAAGLFTLRPEPRFRHPLVRAAAYQCTPIFLRRLVHGVLIQHARERSDVAMAAWHHAEAVAVPNETAAAEAEQAAFLSESEDGLRAAALHARAADLTADRRSRARRLISAAESAWAVGIPGPASRLLAAAEAEARPDDPVAGVDAAMLRARLEAGWTVPGRAPSALRMLAAAESSGGPKGTNGPAAWRNRALEAFDRLFEAESVDGPIAQAAWRARLTTRAALPVGTPEDLLLMGLAGWIGGDIGQSAQTLEESLRSLPAAGRSTRASAHSTMRDTAQTPDAVPGWFALVGPAATALGNPAAAIAWLEGVAERRRASGAVMPGARILMHLQDLYALSGDLLAAKACAAQLWLMRPEQWDPTSSEAAGPAAVSSVPFVQWRAASSPLLAGLTGDDDRLTRLVEARGGAASTGRAGLPGIFGPQTLDAGLCLLHLAHGRYPEALEAARLACAERIPGLTAPLLADLVEAAVRCGETAEAVQAHAALLSHLARLAGGSVPVPGDAAESEDHIALTRTLAATAAPWLAGRALRSGALLASACHQEAGAERLFLAAIDVFDKAGLSLDLARTRLLCGETMRRARRRGDAHPHLRRALHGFTTLDLPAYAERARAELAAASAVRSDGPFGLTSQEQRVYELLMERATNRQIANRLALSPSTVDHHVRRIFQKAGVTSRRALIQTTPAPVTAPAARGGARRGNYEHPAMNVL